MLTKQDLKTELMVVRQEFKTDIENAVAQISSAVIKALENTATKDELKNVENRLGGVENRLGGVENRLGKVEEGLREVKTEVSYLKTEVRDLKTDTPTAKEFQNHEKRITRLEKTALSA